MGWIPEKDRTTGWYLFNELFKVRVRTKDIRTVDDIKMYGTLTSGNEDFDREMDKADQVVMWSIARMEAFYSSGYPVCFVDRKDCERVYELINKHLMFMKDLLGASENSTNNPDTMSELERLDNFADGVFQHARYGLRDNLQHAGYARRARAKDRFARLADLTRMRQPAEETTHQPGTSSVGRQYGTSQDQPPPPADKPLVPDEPIEDPTLPQRVSLAGLFAERRQMGARWK